MKNILTVDNMRNSDSATIKSGISGKELMRRAGEAIFEAVEKQNGWKSPVAIVCGTGNNGGDGYVLALLLKAADISCSLFLLEDKFSEDGRFYFDKCCENSIPHSVVTIEELKENIFSDFSTIADCIYGTGFHGTVTGNNADVIKAINEAGKGGSYIVSVDINSGLNGKNGMTDLCVVSDLTVSVGDYQPGHFLNKAKDVIKAKINCPIGIEPIDRPFYLFEGTDAAACFPERKNFSNKGTYGYVALIGGSSKYSGAIRLAGLANAAMRSGAGVVSVAVPKDLYKTVAASVLESTLYPLSDKDGELVFAEKEFGELIKNKKAVAFGMGIGKSDETKKALEYLLTNYKGILVIDADGLNCLSEISMEKIKNSLPQLVLTPHIKEFSRLTGALISEIQESPCEMAVRYARESGATVLLKGPSTIITDGTEVFITETGCPGMATAGSGDVLSGILAAVLGANTDKPLVATASAAWINGKAGETAQKKYGSISMIASDTIEMLPRVIASLRQNCPELG